MRTKHLFVLIHIGYEGDVGTVKNVLALQYFLLTVPRRCSFYGSFLLFVSRVCLSYCLVCSLQPCSHLQERANLLALLYVMFSCVFVTFPFGVLSQACI